MDNGNEHAYQILYKFSSEPPTANISWTTSKEFKPDVLVGVQGFEPWTPCSQSRCASQTALHSEKVVPPP